MPRAIGTRSTAIEAVPSDEVPDDGRLHVVRPPTVIEPGRLIAGRHPCAWGAENAPTEVEDLVSAGVTLFLDLTQEGELDPYAPLVAPQPATSACRSATSRSRPRTVLLPCSTRSTPSSGRAASSTSTAGPAAGGPASWSAAGSCGMASTPKDALRRIGEARGLGCPQTLEQRFLVLDWRTGQ